MQKAILDLL